MGLIGGLSIVCLVGCNAKTQETYVVEEPKKMDLGLNIDERGEGNFYLVNSIATTEEDKILYEFLDNKDVFLTQLSYEAWGMNAKKVSYIYLDGELVEKTILSDSQSSLTLKNKDLTYGLHTVEVLQFKNGENLKDENIEFYEKAEYVITNDAEEYENNIQNANSKDNELNALSKEDILNSILEKAILGEITPEEMATEVKKQGITEKEFNEYVEAWNNTYGEE